ncbi:MAG: hypothetical protein ABSD20_18235 [Terriglobales bacterium]|jgi:hypothetical protein
MDLAEELNQLAERAVHLADEQFHISLDYSPASLAALDEILRGFRRSIRLRWLLKLTGSGISSEQIWKMAFLWGAYLGLVIQKSFGGEWTLESEAGRAGVVTLHSGSVQSCPMERVYQRLTHGDGMSASKYFEEQRRLIIENSHR